jgi:hypothetical protein
VAPEILEDFWEVETWRKMPVRLRNQIMRTTVLAPDKLNKETKAMEANMTGGNDRVLYTVLVVKMKNSSWFNTTSEQYF